jgi:hypothetical protein
VSFINRGVLQRVLDAGKKEPVQSSTIVSSIAHPHRSLPPGKQWVSHDKPGGQAARRRLRQQAALQAKKMKREYGSSAVSGMTDEGALLLDFKE